MIFVDGDDYSPKYESEKNGKKNKAVAGDALLVTKRTKALDTAGREITDEFGIGRGRTTEMVLDSAEGSNDVVFSDAEIVISDGTSFDLGLDLGLLIVELLEDGFTGGRGGRRGHCGCLRAGGGSNARMGAIALNPGVELVDLRFKGRDLGAQLLGAS